jgi:catechol 2,3-dioxygenase-like lactoylglutathione lyase family enzyme
VRLHAITPVVDDYDRAITHYCDDLGFTLLEDMPLPDGKRWVRVAASRDDPTSLLIARAANDDQRAAIGRQTGGRVGFFLHTDDFDSDHRRLQERGVAVVDGPRSEPYGRVLVMCDAYGNLWDLIEPPGER